MELKDVVVGNTMDGYIKKLLTQTLDAHAVLSELKDKPGDLEIIKKQVEKVESIFKALCQKLGDFSSEEYVSLAKSAKFFVENYDFYDIIEAYKLYDEDPERVKNIRTLVLTALERKDFVKHIQEMLKV